MFYGDLRFERNERKLLQLSQRIMRKDSVTQGGLVMETDDGRIIASEFDYPQEACVQRQGGTFIAVQKQLQIRQQATLTQELTDTFELQAWLENYEDRPWHHIHDVIQAIDGELERVAMGARLLSYRLEPDWGDLYMAMACRRRPETLEYDYAVRFMKHPTERPGMIQIFSNRKWARDAFLGGVREPVSQIALEFETQGWITETDQDLIAWGCHLCGEALPAPKPERPVYDIAELKRFSEEALARGRAENERYFEERAKRMAGLAQGMTL